VHREFAQKHGIFNLNRIPYSFADYFSLDPPSLHLQPPFFRVDKTLASEVRAFSLPFSETFLSIPWCSSWLVLSAIIGMVCLVRSDGTDYFQRWIAVALFAQFVCILSYFALAQRYAADLYPFLIFCFVVSKRSWNDSDADAPRSNRTSRHLDHNQFTCHGFLASFRPEPATGDAYILEQDCRRTRNFN
jgi:hypothetical protein